MRTSFFPRGKIDLVVLLPFLIVFAVFAVLRTLPSTTNMVENHSSFSGDVDVQVFSIFETARARAQEPFEFWNGRLLHFNNRAPAIYMLVSELAIRLGASSPLPIQFVSIVLCCLGMAAMYFWTTRIFGSRLAGVTSQVFVVSNPYLLFHASSLHLDPYNFFFLNLFILFLLRYLHDQRPWDRYLACACYFGVFLSHFMLWICAFVLSLGFVRYYRPRQLKNELGWICGLPSLSLVIMLVQIHYTMDGFGAFFRQVHYRTVGTNSEFLNPVFYLFSYPFIVSQRVSSFFSFTIPQYFLLLAVSYLLYKSLHRPVLRIFYFVIPAALSWNIVAVETTVEHRFAANYSYLLWMLVTVAFVQSIIEFVRARPEFVNKKASAVIALLPLAVLLFKDFEKVYLRNALIYLKEYRVYSTALARKDSSLQDELHFKARYQLIEDSYRSSVVDGEEQALRSRLKPGPRLSQSFDLYSVPGAEVPEFIILDLKKPEISDIETEITLSCPEGECKHRLDPFRPTKAIQYFRSGLFVVELPQLQGSIKSIQLRHEGVEVHYWAKTGLEVDPE